MKKITILLFLLYSCLISQSQKKITTNGPCTDTMAHQVIGRWIKVRDLGSISSKEAYSRLDEIHNMILKIYPQPTGVDVEWHRAAGISYFGAKRKYSQTENIIRSENTGLPHFIKYYYRAGFFRYWCDHNNKNSMWPGSPGESGTWITITANEIEGSVGGASDNPWTINGLPVRMRNPVLKTIRGFEMQYPEPGSNARYVLVHRNGVLPYIPVTRKQYLDKCIAFTAALFDKSVEAAKQMPVRSPEEQEKEKKDRLARYEKDFGSDPKRLKSAVDYYLSAYQTDQQRRDEDVEKIKKTKKEELKKFTDELDKTTKDGLLDSPAQIVVLFYSSPVFETDPLKGKMLVTENPDYIHKDLPKHVPQVFVVWWTFNNWASQERINEIMEQDFPFEKLHAMIDK